MNPITVAQLLAWCERTGVPVLGMKVTLIERFDDGEWRVLAEGVVTFYNTGIVLEFVSIAGVTIKKWEKVSIPAHRTLLPPWHAVTRDTMVQVAWAKQRSREA